MNLLLDTQIVLWWLANDPRLPEGAREAIADAEVVCVSAASALEIAIKAALGKLKAPDDFEEQLKHHHFTPLPITVAHALAVQALPPHHGDPFDRLLIAQARLERLTLLTADRTLDRYGEGVRLV